MGQSIEPELAALVRERAFDRVATQALDQYGAELYGFLVSLVGNEPDAAEVFAQVSEDFWKGIPSFGSRCSMRTWLYVLARNAAAVSAIAKALSVMHARGIVHRDLKPSNVLLEGNVVKVADFGLAGLIEHAPLAATGVTNEDVRALTLTGAIMGTPLYMAPELVRGAGEAGPPADVFSFGVLAYELLSRKLPFAVPPVLERLSGRQVPAPVPLGESSPHLPARLCALVDSCLALAPEARPTAEPVAAALETS